MTLTPPEAEPVKVRYWNTHETNGDKLTYVSHCHIVGERLFCCGLEVTGTFAQRYYTDEPAFALDEVCQFVVDAINRGAAVSWKYAK